MYVTREGVTGGHKHWFQMSPDVSKAQAAESRTGTDIRLNFENLTDLIREKSRERLV